jgi:outer membrane protein TolC
VRRLTDFVRTFAIPLLFMTAWAVLAQTVDHASGIDALSLADALALAQQKYPAIKAALEQQSAAKDQIGVAKAAYLPRVDMLWQTNRATDNNHTGLMLPQGVLPSISGPVVVDAPGKSAWSSAGGTLINWQPFDFGKRARQVDVAEEGAVAAANATDLTRLGITARTAAAFLDAAAAHELVAVAQANVNRMQTFANSVHVLVDNKLRPGADASQADAQFAFAKTQLIQAQTQERIRLAALAALLEIPPQQIKVDASSVLAVPPAAAPEATAINAHSSNPAGGGACCQPNGSTPRPDSILCSSIRFAGFDFRSWHRIRQSGQLLGWKFGPCTHHIELGRSNSSHLPRVRLFRNPSGKEGTRSESSR